LSRPRSLMDGAFMGGSFAHDSFMRDGAKGIAVQAAAQAEVVAGYCNK
jgi:hypothetical protein